MRSRPRSSDLSVPGARFPLEDVRGLRASRRLPSLAGREWPLAVFTLLSQAAIGTFVALGGVALLLESTLPGGLVTQAFRGPLLAVGLLFWTGLAFSTRHLARPLNAWWALRNVGRSWVSIEVSLALAFGLVGSVFVGLEWFDLGGEDARAVTAGLAGALGIGFVYAMGQLYRVPSRPAWRHPSTLVAFFVSTAVLGTLTAAAVVVVTAYPLAPAIAFPDRLIGLDRVLHALALAGLAALAVELALVPWQWGIRQAASRRTALPERPRETRRQALAAGVRLLLIAGAAAPIAWFALRAPWMSGAEPEGRLALAAGFLLSWIESAIGRVAFYADRPIDGV